MTTPRPHHRGTTGGHPTRRQAVIAGAGGLLGFTLADLLRAEAATDAATPAGGRRTGFKAVINVHLDGGPPQHETIDPKPDAPEEIRGDLRPVRTKVPGLHVCELMPRVAALADRFAFVRSLTGSAGAHDAFQCQSGFPASDLRGMGGRPAMGSVVGKLLGSPDDGVPAFVDAMQGRPLVRDSARPGFLGPAFAPFRPDLSALFARQLEEGMKAELAARGADHTVRLTLTEGLSLERLNDRMSLLAGFDAARRAVDARGSMDAVDRFHRQAVGILTSGKLGEALDLEREPAKSRDRYILPAATRADGAPDPTDEDAGAGRKLLLARRLVEAGVRCVSVSISDFDTHARNFPRMKHLMPIVDHALAALAADLTERGLADDVAVVAWGEFGRTPRVNKDGGRDHWPEVGPALLFGGGIRGGRVVGATDRVGAKITDRPVTYQDVMATLWQCLGVDAGRTTLVDPTGRPQHLLPSGEPIRELL